MRQTTFNELREKEVINCCTGTRLGYITDLRIDEECGRIISIIVSDACRKFSFNSSRDQSFLVCWENIQKIGKDFIVIDQSNCCVTPIPPKRERKFFI